MIVIKASNFRDIVRVTISNQPSVKVTGYQTVSFRLRKTNDTTNNISDRDNTSNPNQS